MTMRLRMRTQYPLPHGPGDRHLATVSPPPPPPGRPSRANPGVCKPKTDVRKERISVMVQHLKALLEHTVKHTGQHILKHHADWDDNQRREASKFDLTGGYRKLVLIKVW